MADDGSEEGGVNDPIDISKRRTPAVEDIELWSADDMIKVDNARHTRHLQTGLLVFLGLVVAGLLTPLVVFLVRVASGG